MTDEKKFVDQFLDTNLGYGYGDPDARLQDDRRITIILAKQQNEIQNRQIKAQKQLNWLTLMLVFVGIVNILMLFIKR